MLGREPGPGRGVVVCMGDTLTHLGSQREVSELLDHVASTLAPGGLFITTFRNYVGHPLEDDQRFIAIRADGDWILTCYLECLEDHVRVHDIVHVARGTSGSSQPAATTSFDSTPTDSQ